MFIILIAHIPDNSWALWIPARFGFSDATEMFVFQSGMASAVAFGMTFDRYGIFALLGRTVQRIWQIFWAHIAVFVVIAAMMGAAGLRYDGVSYVETLNLTPFVRDPINLLAGLLTLRYVPNYFDILPMYIVILGLMPVMILAEKIHRTVPLALMFVLWLATQIGSTGLPAEPWSDRRWFFNPLGWQLLFFSGFFLMRGTFRAPDFDRRLMALAVAIVVASVPFALVRFYEMHTALQAVATNIMPFTDKTSFGALRFIHFLALCYIAVYVVGKHKNVLRGPVANILSVVGQQSLAVFVVGMVTAQAIGIALDAFGRTNVSELAANVIGFIVLITTAYTARWFKKSPKNSGAK
ncbi:hypothetical protein N185_15715 [Sinorhizobium sp. GW3]|nr:hypothetical protein N185_15715 [Sinorhizobium sp. GW3]